MLLLGPGHYGNYDNIAADAATRSVRRIGASTMNTVAKRFAVYFQDYTLVFGENGPGDVKQKAVGPVHRFATLFPSRAAARKFLNEFILPDARAEGYQSEYWIGRYPPRKKATT